MRSYRLHDGRRVNGVTISAWFFTFGQRGLLSKASKDRRRQYVENHGWETGLARSSNGSDCVVCFKMEKTDA